MLSEYYKAATEGVAIAEKDWTGLLKLTGAERASWLQGMVTNDVLKLVPGAGCYAAHLTSQGKIVAQMHVLADASVLWLSLERAAMGKLIDAFDKLLIMEDVQMTEVSDEYSILGLVGPKAGHALEAWLGEPLKLSARYSHRLSGDCRVVVSDM